MEESPSNEKLPLPITADEAKGPNIEAMKLVSSEVLTSMMELDVLGTVEGGAEEVDAVTLDEDDAFLKSCKALILFAYSHVSGR